MIKSKRLLFGAVNVVVGLTWVTTIHLLKDTDILSLATAYGMIGGFSQFVYTAGDTARKSNCEKWGA